MGAFRECFRARELIRGRASVLARRGASRRLHHGARRNGAGTGTDIEAGRPIYTRAGRAPDRGSNDGDVMAAIGSATGAGAPPRAAGAGEQALLDPPRPAGFDGWTPDAIRVVRSRHDGGFLGSAFNFAMGGIRERPGQRLSSQMIDALAPYYAATYGLDELFLRRELAKVYVYVGGPAVDGSAMTIGHHVFVPDEQSLRTILSPGGKRWLVHELAHTAQFLAHSDASPHAFLASYIKGIAVGHDPTGPGEGHGPRVWGALFTGLRTDGEESIGRPAATLDQRVAFSIFPAATIGVPTALAAGGALAVARRVLEAPAGGGGARRAPVLGNRNALLTTGALIAAPLMAGSLAGVYADTYGAPAAEGLGAALAAAIAGTALVTGGALSGFGKGALPLGATWGHLLAGGATITAGALGWMAARTSANTIDGWSRTADHLHQNLRSKESEAPVMERVHDAHWQEIDAEATARRMLARRDSASDRTRPAAPAAPPPQPRDRRHPLRDRLDWVLWNPLIIGIPAAAAAGAGTLATRTGVTLLRGVRAGRPLGAVGEALRNLSSSRRGILNSLGVGASLTLAPLLTGAAVGQAADLVLDQGTSRLAGAGAAAVVTGATLTMLYSTGPGGSLLSTTPRVLAGMAVAGALGFVSASAAVGALHPRERQYQTR